MVVRACRPVEASLCNVSSLSFIKDYAADFGLQSDLFSIVLGLCLVELHVEHVYLLYLYLAVLPGNPWLHL